MRVKYRERGLWGTFGLSKRCTKEVVLKSVTLEKEKVWSRGMGKEGIEFSFAILNSRCLQDIQVREDAYRGASVTFWNRNISLVVIGIRGVIFNSIKWMR